jgi:hypothetical protein
MADEELEDAIQYFDRANYSGASPARVKRRTEVIQKVLKTQGGLVQMQSKISSRKASIRWLMRSLRMLYSTLILL